MSLFPITGPAGALTGLSTPGTGQDDVPLVLVHGIQGSARAWSQVLEHLPARIPAVAPNLRGRGGSVAPEEPAAYALEAFAEDLAAVLDALGRPVVLVGWSMGALVSLAYIQRYGEERLRALALISGTAQGKACQWFRGETAAEICVEAERRAQSLALVEAAAPIAAAGAWLSARESDCRTLLPHIQLPTLVIHGTDDDQCPPSHGRLMAEQIADARLAVHEGGVHNLLAQNPARVAEQLAGLYASVRAPV